MRKELDEALCAKYPLIFADRHGKANETAMCWGFAHGDGWYPLLDRLCGIIQHHCDNPAREKDPATGLYTIIIPRTQVVALQVKEKFGGLRFYVSGADDYLWGAIAMAENMSYSVCEECGTTKGVTTEGSWVRSLCGPCRAAKASKQNEN